MGEFGRREAFLCVLVGLVIGLLIGVNVLGPGAVPWPVLGWGFGPYIGLFWLFIWLMLIRGLFWGRPWRRGRYYYGRLDDLPADFDDWHRRAHERMKEAPAADDSGRRG
jgi:hypothetical protein